MPLSCLTINATTILTQGGNDEPKFPFGLFPNLIAFAVFFIWNKGLFANFTLFEMFLCSVAGFVSVIAIVSHVYAFQLGKAAIVAPFHYSQLVWGIIFGFLLFGDVPDIWSISGATVTISAGLLLYLDDLRAKRKKRKKEQICTSL